MNYTIKDIAREVRTTMVELGVGQKEAADLISLKIVGRANGRIRQLHKSGFLSFACAQAEASTLRSDPVLINGGNHDLSDTQMIAEAPVRTRYDAFYDDPLSTWLPVANRGRKQLRDITREDLLAMHHYYRAAGTTLLAKAKEARRVALQMEPGETVGEAWDRLSDEYRKLLT